MPVSLRPNRAALRVHGKDAQKLLNDVLTVEISAVPGDAHWWALLSPQGKIQAEGLAAWHDDAFWLDVHVSVIDAFIKRMRLYRLRAEVEFDDLRESHCVGWSAEDDGTNGAARDPRANDMGYRLIAPKDDVENWSETSDLAVTARINTGISELGEDFATDQMFPHDIGMDILSGIDFDKGCYVGQEVVSRMQHRGTARRRPAIVSGVDAPSGTGLTCNEREIGVLGQVLDGKAIALVRIDRVTGPVTIADKQHPVELALPGWASYRFADSTDA